MAQQALGIDCSNGKVKSIRVEGSPKKFKIAGFSAIPVTQQEGEAPSHALTRALKETFDKNPGPKDATAVVISSARCAFRPLTLPFVGDEQIQKVVKFELEGQIHQWNIDDVVVDYYPILEDKGQTQLLVAAAPKEHLKHVFKACEAAGFDPIAADLDAMAYYNAALACNAIEDDGTFMFLHVEEQRALLLIVENKTLKLARSIRIAAVKTPKLSAAEEPATEGSEPAPDAKASETGPANQESPASDEEVLFVSIEEEGKAPLSGKEIVPLLLRETGRSLASLRLEKPLSRIYLSGLWQQVEGLASSFEQRYRQAVWNFDVFEFVEHNLSKEQVDHAAPDAPLAFGAALKLIGIDAGGMNLRQEDLRFTKRFDQVKREVAILVCGLALVLALENAFFFKKNDTKSRDYETWYKETLDKTQALTEKKYTVAPGGDPLKRIADLRRKVEEDQRQLNEKMGKASDLRQPQSAFEAWKMFFAAIKTIEPQLAPFMIEKIDANYQESTSKDREASVSLSANFVFLGDQLRTSSAMDSMLNHLSNQPNFIVYKDKSSATTLPQGGGIKVPVLIDIKVTEVTE